MAKLESPSTLRDFPLSVLDQSVSLATAGFGVVVALAWNEFVQSLITQYVQPYLGSSSGVVSQGVYALAITILAVFVTMQLVRLQQMFQRSLRK